MDELLRDFVVETIEHLDVIDAELVRFEREPQNQSIVTQIFRLVHTIKGTCGFLGLARLEKVAHLSEALISRFRDGVLVTQQGVSLVLSCLDRIKSVVVQLSETGKEPAGDDQDLIREVNAFLNACQIADASSVSKLDDLTRGTLVYQVLERSLRPGEVTLDELEAAFRSAPGPSDTSSDNDNVSVENLPHREGAASSAVFTDTLTRQSVRVSIDRLDHLMNMVSELVLIRNQMIDISRREDMGRVKGPLQRLSHITAELQDGVMRTRMQPIGVAWAKLPRLVRDLATELGKQITVETSGDTTEIDRQLLEIIKDCLVHLVRNSASHGIETVAERIAADKSPQGLIRLAARQEGSHIIIEIGDDGRGLDLERVLQRGRERGLVKPDIRPADGDIARLIFEPGFSTTDQITSISGRGVGLDAVLNSIENIGGSVDVTNRPGQGMTMTLRLPLTLAIAAALIVESGGQRFALPQVVISEVLRINGENGLRIERIHGEKMLRMHDKLMPILALGDVLGLSRDENAGEASFVIICQSGAMHFGLMVDAILQTEEIVVKPVSAKLRQIPFYSGVTILGDGAVILILEPIGLARALGQANSGPELVEPVRDVRGAANAEEVSMLLYRAGDSRPRAVMLSLIARLEEFDAASIELAGSARVVQYKDRLVPVFLADPAMVIAQSGPQPALVFQHSQQNVIILVDEIVDVVRCSLMLDMSYADDQHLGAAIVQGQTTLVLDPAAYLKGQMSDDRGPVRSAHERRVLLVEPSDFFRSMLPPLLRSAGFETYAVAGFDEAIKLGLEHLFDIAIVDLDVSLRQALQFADRLEQDSGGHNVMFIGLATRPGPPLTQQAQAGGYTDVIGKFDRQSLLTMIKSGIPSRERAA